MSSWSSAVLRRAALVREARDARQLGLFARSLCFATLLPLLLRLSPARLKALLEPSSDPPRAGRREGERIASTVLAMLSAGRPIVRRGCLTRGVTLYYFLRRAGVDVSLCFGIGRVEGGDGFDGHCWLELDGEPWLEPREPRALYATMYAFGRPAPSSSTCAKDAP
jgi:hypothetical protein